MSLELIHIFAKVLADDATSLPMESKATDLGKWIRKINAAEVANPSGLRAAKGAGAGTPGPAGNLPTVPGDKAAHVGPGGSWKMEAWKQRAPPPSRLRVCSTHSCSASRQKGENERALGCRLSGTR